MLIGKVVINNGNSFSLSSGRLIFAAGINKKNWQ